MKFSRARKLWIAASLAIAVVLAIALRSAYSRRYPYGQSHCCIVQLAMALRMYAEANGGKFPTGQSSPEASLSLLYRNELATPGLLRGKTVPEKLVKRILSEGGLLGPDTCGWHYVDGLTLSNDNSTAIVWDKVGLGHNSEDSGFREVGFIDGSHQLIRKTDWEKFLASQQKLRQKR